MPSIVTIPERANSVSFKPEEVREHADFLSRVDEGGAVAMDSTFKTENKARTRGKKMADLIKSRYGITPRVHIVPEGEGDEKTHRPALSVKSEDVDTLTGALEAEDNANAEGTDAEDPDPSEPDDAGDNTEDAKPARGRRSPAAA